MGRSVSFRQVTNFWYRHRHFVFGDKADSPRIVIYIVGAGNIGTAGHRDNISQLDMVNDRGAVVFFEVKVDKFGVNSRGVEGFKFIYADILSR